LNLFESLVARARGSDAIAQPLVRPVDALALVPAFALPVDAAPEGETVARPSTPGRVVEAPPAPASVSVAAVQPATATGSPPSAAPVHAAALPPRASSPAMLRESADARDAPPRVEHRHTIERRIESTHERVVQREVAVAIEPRVEHVAAPRPAGEDPPRHRTPPTDPVAASPRAHTPEHAAVPRPPQPPPRREQAPPRAAATAAIAPRIEHVPARSADSERAPDPVVHVHIDRIVVRAEPRPATPPRAAAPAGPTGAELLSRYLARRSTKP